MKKLNLLIIPIIIVFIMSSCDNKPDSATNSTWYEDCEGLKKDYGGTRVSSAACRLLEKKVGRNSDYRFSASSIEKRGDCEFLVTVTAQSGIGQPKETLRVRVKYDGTEFYLVN